MANDDKMHHDDELGKAPAVVECEVTASQLRSLVDTTTNVTPDDNRRILRKLDMWSVVLPPHTKTTGPLNN